MRINVSKEYREEFEVFISEYRKFCDGIIDLVVNNVPIEKLITCCWRIHRNVMQSLTDTISSRDIMRGIINKCSITNITPLKDVIEHYNIAEGKGMTEVYPRFLMDEMIGVYQPSSGNGMIKDYQRSLDEYLSKLRVRYSFGSSKDIVNAETIIFILDWTPDDTSFLHIKHLLYKAFYHLGKRIIVQATGKKILHLLKYLL